MKAQPFKVAVQFVGGLVIATFFVVLLTFIFSFLGTIFCAALAGMMLGALRTMKWQSVPISLLFPLVIFTLLRGMRTEMGGRQVLLVSVLCFLVFWVSYGMAAMLFWVERKGPATTGRRARSPHESAAHPAGGNGPVAAAALAVEAPHHNGFLSLEALQGSWSDEPDAPARTERKRMEIERERLTLSVADGRGQFRILGKAHLRLCTPGSVQTLLLSDPMAEAACDTLVSI